MSQHDMTIANQTASAARTDINNALQALASTNSGGTAPSPTFANQLWYDTTNSILKQRNEANSAWCNLLYIDQTSNVGRILDDTQVVNTSGTQTGLLGNQSTATWQAGTGTTQSLVSPANVKSAIDALGNPHFGEGKTWQAVTRTSGTSYQNTTGQTIFFGVNGNSSGGSYIQLSSNNSTWIDAYTGSAQANVWGYAAIPNGYYYRTGTADAVYELR